MLQPNRENPSRTLAEIFKAEREVGRREGKIKAQQSFAKKLLMINNMSVEEIAELSELTIDKVEKLKKELQK